MVDTLGLVCKRLVHPANVSDPAGARQLLPGLKRLCPRLVKMWADSVYGGPLVDWVASRLGCTLEIVKRSDDLKGFVVLPKRWIVERTFGWLNRSRRLSKDYEFTPKSSEAWIDLAMIQLMVKRLTKK